LIGDGREHIQPEFFPDPALLFPASWYGNYPMLRERLKIEA